MKGRILDRNDSLDSRWKNRTINPGNPCTTEEKVEVKGEDGNGIRGGVKSVGGPQRPVKGVYTRKDTENVCQRRRTL